MSVRTCTECGERETQTIPRIEIDFTQNSEYGLANFTVVHAQTLEPIAGASIFITTDNDGEGTIFTDANGRVSQVLPVGLIPVQVFAEGTLVRPLNIRVNAGVNEIPRIGLSDRSPIDAELTHRLMTREEIIEAGIDPNAPGNRHVYEYELRINFRAELDVISLLPMFNGNGEFLGFRNPPPPPTNRPDAPTTSVWTWGSNSNGQLGNGSLVDSSIPIPAQHFYEVSTVAAGGNHTVVLGRTDWRWGGDVWTWGANESGQLGDGTTTDRTTPVRVQGINDVIAIAAGDSHTVALRRNGTVWTWGKNSLIPVQVQGLDNITAIAAGGGHTVALRSDGTVWAWGENSSGQLGNGTTTSSVTPVQVQGLNNVAVISAGGSHTVAITSDRIVFAWGDNSLGQLGDGTTTSRNTPVQVQGLGNVFAIAAGGSHNLAIRSDNSVWAWGNNSHSQLGDGTTINRSTPVRVQNLSTVSSISAGGSHSIARRSDGTAWVWGNNSNGQLGDGTTINRDTPTQVRYLRNMSVIAAGGNHSANFGSMGGVSVFNGPGSGGGSGGGGGWGFTGPNGPFTIFPISEQFYLIIHGEVSWLKEMFDVELLVINNSMTDTIENAVAELILPQGLSLADMLHGQQSPIREIGHVPEGESTSVNWFVRGDEEGVFDIAALLSGVIMPFYEPFKYEFIAHDPIKVYAGSALHLTFYIPNSAFYAEDYTVTIVLENVSSRPIYGLTHTILGVRQGVVRHYSDGSVVDEEYMSTGIIGSQSSQEFRPGDRMVIEVTTNIMFQSEIIQRELERVADMLHDIESIMNAVTVVNNTINILSGMGGLLSSLNSMVDAGRIGVETAKGLYSIYDFGRSLSGEQSTFNMYDFILDMVSAIPVRFVVDGIAVTTLESSTTTIPHSIQMQNVGARHVGIDNIGRIMNNLVIYAMGQHDVSVLGIPIIRDITGHERARQELIAIQGDVSKLAARTATGTTTFRSWIEPAGVGRMASDSLFTLSSDNETAQFADGVLTFTGEGIIEITPHSTVGGTLFIDMGDGQIETFEITVFEPHDCYGSDWEVLVPPIGDMDGIRVLRCDTCSDVVKLDIMVRCDNTVFSEWVVEVEPTSTVVGIQTRTCINCGLFEFEILEELDHCCEDYPDCDCADELCCEDYPDCECTDEPCCEDYPDCDCPDEPPTIYPITVATAVTDYIAVSPVTAEVGDTITVTIAPPIGQRLIADGVTATGVEVFTGNTVGSTSVTFIKTAGATEVNATFENIPPVTYPITVATAVTAYVTVSPTEAEVGDTVTVTITPPTGQRLVENGVSATGVTKFTDNTAGSILVTFVKTAGATEVNAAFEDIPSVSLTGITATHIGGGILVDHASTGTVMITNVPSTVSDVVVTLEGLGLRTADPTSPITLTFVGDDTVPRMATQIVTISEAGYADATITITAARLAENSLSLADIIATHTGGGVMADNAVSGMVAITGVPSTASNVVITLEGLDARVSNPTSPIIMEFVGDDSTPRTVTQIVTISQDGYADAVIVIMAIRQATESFLVSVQYGVTGVTIQGGPQFVHGAIITLNITPPSGQRLVIDGITATGATITNVAGATSATFTMPDNDVIITDVAFEPIPTNLVSITTPLALSITHAQAVAGNWGLPTTVGIVVDLAGPPDSAEVIWGTPSGFDPAVTIAQTVTFSGTVTLPEGLTNTNNVVLTTAITVNVAAALDPITATLTNLTVSQGTLMPAFSPNVFNYTVNVGNPVTSITVNAVAASGATVTGTGVHHLSIGQNTITLIVTAPGAATQTYTVVVARASVPGGDGGGWTPAPTTPSLSTPTNVRIDNTIVSWNAVNNASGYRIYVGGIARSGVVTTTSFDLATLELPVGTHAIRVRAIFDGASFNNSALSITLNFVVQDAPITTPEPTPTPEIPVIQEPTVPTPEWVNPFVDVSANNWFFDSVRFVHQNNLFSGTSLTTFSPNMTMTRGMMVTVLHRMAGTPQAGSAGFTDVADGQWYADAVNWAAANGIVAGFGDGRFAPNDNITREQMAQILNNYARFMELELPSIRSGSFNDEAQISTWALQAVNAMFEAGIISGRGEGNFDPQGNATRAEVATLLRNFIEAIKEES